MSRLFADSSYFLALISRRDADHQRAVAYAATNPDLVTTDFVLLEVFDGLSAPSHRPLAIELHTRLRADRHVTIVPADRALFDRGHALYLARPDKHWSLTDCTSFVVMTDLHLTEALTADHHFEQAGFTPLLK